MRTLLVLAGALLIALPAVAAAKTKKPVKPQPQQQIACTVIGCVPVPRGCGQTARPHLVRNADRRRRDRLSAGRGAVPLEADSCRRLLR